MKERIITGLIAGLLFLLFLYLGNKYILFAAFILAVVGLIELLKMRNNNLKAIHNIYAMILLIIIFGQNIFGYQFFTQVGLTLSILVALFIPVITKNKTTFEDMTFAFFSFIYIGIGFYSLALIRLEYGFVFSLMILLTIWGTDTAAYFTGYLLKGRGPKLWEAISPKKTVVGAIGGTVAAVLIIILMDKFILELLTITQQITLGLTISIVGQIGDLAQSAYKRFYNVKDSGKILPGHGGILDRFDSMLFVFPLIYVIIQFI